MPFVSVNGARLYYRLEGRDDRPTLILSNSLGTDFGMWDRQVPALTEAFRVLRYDTRGHGASDAPAGEYTVAQLGQDVMGLTEALGIKSFAFCGVSLGGMIGLWLGVNRPDRLTALVIANSSAHLPPPEGWSNRIRIAHSHGMTALVDPVMERFFSETYRRRQEPFFHTIRRTFLSTAPHGYAGCCAAVRDADFRADVRRIATPTLVIGGEADIATPAADHAEPLAASIPGAEYAVLPAGHVSNVEVPEAFSELVRRFVSGRARSVRESE